MADAVDLKSSGETHVGSTPTRPIFIDSQKVASEHTLYLRVYVFLDLDHTINDSAANRCNAAIKVP